MKKLKSQNSNVGTKIEKVTLKAKGCTRYDRKENIRFYTQLKDRDQEASPLSENSNESGFRLKHRNKRQNKLYAIHYKLYAFCAFRLDG
ncbi:hypothetical protein COV04_04165 [Candidatus Uhrbacteria bacterium CG10_big_fil_rev_8_21_14_0_10_48_11]|uniref:Uncharacterized protein n=1 Tax=Candidatus Uhrbacteria bacterium CG10_big_fil_rev_8_21_14_0_10_48_11 TaxID=1975037 RepID=A0A2M8LDR9_9BACT|nr:MAG: hypothetical protein COV04_04165 [Candidatus Uhrbacteria bacterium CG10_big_fil_rev_8_21_14_0_10_48_11]